MDVESDGEAQLSRIDNLKTILLRIIGSLGNLENERPEIESSTKAAMESISDLIVLLKEDRRKEECVVFVTFFQMNPIKKSILPLLYKADQEDKCRIVELFFLISRYADPLQNGAINDPVSVAEYLHLFKRTLLEIPLWNCLMLLVKEQCARHLSGINEGTKALGILFGFLTHTLSIGDVYPLGSGVVVESKGLQNSFLAVLNKAKFLDFFVSAVNCSEEFQLQKLMPHIVLVLNGIFWTAKRKLIASSPTISSLLQTEKKPKVSLSNQRFVGTFGNFNEALGKGTLSTRASSSALDYDSMRKKQAQKRKVRIQSSEKSIFSPLDLATEKVFGNFVREFMHFSFNDLIVHFSQQLVLPENISIFSCIISVSVDWFIRLKTADDSGSLQWNQMYSILQKQIISKLIATLDDFFQVKKYDLCIEVLTILNSIFSVIFSIATISAVGNEEREMIRFWCYHFSNSAEFHRLLRDLLRLKIGMRNFCVCAQSVYWTFLFIHFGSMKDLPEGLDIWKMKEFSPRTAGFSSMIITEDLVMSLFVLLKESLLGENHFQIHLAAGLLRALYTANCERSYFFKISIVRRIHEILSHTNARFHQELVDFLENVSVDFIGYLMSKSTFGLDVFFQFSSNDLNSSMDFDSFESYVPADSTLIEAEPEILGFVDWVYQIQDASEPVFLPESFCDPKYTSWLGERGFQLEDGMLSFSEEADLEKLQNEVNFFEE